MIRRKAFKHGWYYHYKVHNAKANSLNNGLESLKDYLYSLFEECPDEYFQKGPRGSGLKFKLPLDPICTVGHEVCLLARKGLEENYERYKQDHPKVQMFMLEYDNKTIAMEVPIWILPEELENFKKIFKSNIPLTGHIDILRFEDGKVWIWDYKPCSQNEKYASTQVFFYAVMLSKRAGIPLENLRCGYFDSNYAFMFKPEEVALKKNSSISDYSASLL